MSRKRHGTRRPDWRSDSKFLRNVAEAVDVPEAVLTGGVRVELFENRELLIENHKGILEYGDQCIRICCGDMAVKVEGEGLTLVSMSRDALSLKGNILSLSYGN